MSILQTVATTAKFEIKNSVTARRLAVSTILMLFPPSMLFLILFASGGAVIDINMVICIFVFIIGLLSLLLWATPNVYAELESRGWIYLTARSYGRVGLLLGKYVSAISNSWLICVISVALCLLVGDSLAGFSRPLPLLFLGYIGIITLSVLSYGAIYSLIGVVFQRRSMVIGAVYTLISDLVMASIPALISKLSVRYYLHGLAMDWLAIDLAPQDIDSDVLFMLNYPAEGNTFLQVVSLLIISALALGVAAYIIRYREYVTTDET